MGYEDEYDDAEEEDDMTPVFTNLCGALGGVGQLQATEITHTATLVPGLNFTCLRLHGRIEGNVNELCAQLEKSRPIKVESGNSNKKKRRSDYDSPHAAPVRRRYIDMNDDTDGGEDRIGVFRRKLSDDFDRIVGEMTTKANKKSIKSGTQDLGSVENLQIFERCAAVDTVSLVARILHKSKALLQSMLMSRNGSLVEDFFGQLVGSVPDLTEHLHMTTARILRHYVDRIANSKWEVKELGVEHNGFVQNLLLEYGIEIFAETLVEGLSRIKICTDEGRALMSLDIQLYCTSLSSTNVKPKLQIVDTFIKAYYPPGMEYVHWARAHPVVGLVTLVATMKGWKRKTRLELVDKIEAAAA
ncbi:hypothetical protein YC2023_099123 [Brassica napus]